VADVEPILLTRYRAKIAEYLRARALPSHRLTGRMVAYHMGWADAEGRAQSKHSGKFVRPSLCVWACVACGGDETDALPVAAAVEWTHNATLVHDDIQDGDHHRRGRRTVWSLWGVEDAINAGDVLHVLAFGALAEDGVNAPRALLALRALASATLDVIEGQSLDLAHEGNVDARLRPYLRIARAKTGALIGASLETGALMAGAGAARAATFARAGRLLGTAFQMRDDWLGIWGDPRKTGKSSTADVRNRKVTYPAIAAYQRMSALQRGRLRELFESDRSGVDDEIRSLLEDAGAAEIAQAAPLQYARKATAAIERTGIDRAAIESFREVAHYVATRAR